MGEWQNTEISERFVAALAGTDSYGIFYIVNKDFTITVIAGGDLLGNLTDDCLYNLFSNNGFYLYFREKIDRILVPRYICV